MLNALRRSSENARLVRSFYEVLTSQSRQPVFFIDFGVADTIDGRFDMVALHAWLILSWLADAGFEDLARALSDALFVGFDEALRELGAGDMSMGRKIKQMGNAFNGRVQAYDCAAGEVELAAAILRNIYRGDESRRRDALTLARYARSARASLSGCAPLSDTPEFGALPQRVLS